MKFWDSSAIVALCVRESHAVALRSIVTADRDLVAWWCTRTECVSAITQRARAGLLSSNRAEQANARLDALARGWLEVAPTEAVRDRAERLLPVHRLRSADAFQLAAALAWCQNRTAGAGFVTLDLRLRDAGDAEGFEVLPNLRRTTTD